MSRARPIQRPAAAARRSLDQARWPEPKATEQRGEHDRPRPSPGRAGERPGAEGDEGDLERERQAHQRRDVGGAYAREAGEGGEPEGVKAVGRLDAVEARPEAAGDVARDL
ncbi:MAG: hypothetical protein MUF34_14855 [Polyangiaceae bacterium]|nr:hypothetical protein [Polyangiaceae bacterium]